MSIDRRKFLKTSLLATTGALASPYIISSPVRAAGTIDVGVLFSLTGGLSIIEKSLHDATLMAISEINASGGAKGMKINAIVEDGASDPKTYNEKASKLVIQDRVPTVFGSYTSASRKAVLPVFEKRNNLYFYPTYYEGFECSKNVVYTGAVPNQQLSNFIPWIIKTLGKKKFFIVGSNYIYPREMAKVSQDPDREKRRRMDCGRISRAWAFGMGFHGQQDQGIGLRRRAVERRRRLRSLLSIASTRTRG